MAKTVEEDNRVREMQRKTKYQKEEEERLQRQREQEAQRLAAERKAEEERRLAEREGKLRGFTLKEAPELWDTYQALGVEITGHDARIKSLRSTLEEFGKRPEEDPDFRHICSIRDEMAEARRKLHAKMEEAYLAACKYAATPGRKEYEETRRRILEDGLREAEAAVSRFDEMRRTK